MVSAYTQPGYISGALPTPGETQPYIHDFGSILNFIEWALGQNRVPLSFQGYPGLGISPTYPYADYLAPDGWLAHLYAFCKGGNDKAGPSALFLDLEG